MSDDLDGYLASLPDKLEAKLAGRFRAVVEKHADHIRDAAPVGLTGNTRDSVRVEEEDGPFELVILAGGPLTTKSVGTRTYRRQVVIGSDDTQNIPKGNAPVVYDYANAEEFGTEHQAANPWFYPTHHEFEGEIEDDIANLAEDGDFE